MREHVVVWDAVVGALRVDDGLHLGAGADERVGDKGPHDSLCAIDFGLSGERN